MGQTKSCVSSMWPAVSPLRSLNLIFCEGLSGCFTRSPGWWCSEGDWDKEWHKVKAEYPAFWSWGSAPTLTTSPIPLCNAPCTYVLPEAPFLAYLILPLSQLLSVLWLSPHQGCHLELFVLFSLIVQLLLLIPQSSKGSYVLPPTGSFAHRACNMPILSGVLGNKGGSLIHLHMRDTSPKVGSGSSTPAPVLLGSWEFNCERPLSWIRDGETKDLLSFTCSRNPPIQPKPKLLSPRKEVPLFPSLDPSSDWEDGGCTRPGG